MEKQVSVPKANLCDGLNELNPTSGSDIGSLTHNWHK